MPRMYKRARSCSGVEDGSVLDAEDDIRLSSSMLELDLGDANPDQAQLNED